jgi:hypothetical protein
MSTHTHAEESDATPLADHNDLPPLQGDGEPATGTLRGFAAAVYNYLAGRKPSEWGSEYQALLYAAFDLSRAPAAPSRQGDARERGYCDAFSMGLCDGDEIDGEGPCACKDGIGETLADKIDRSLEAALDNAGIYDWDIRRAVLDCRDELLDDLRDHLAALRSAPDYPPAGWTPTPEAINALPDPIRSYIHDLETRADPAGEVRELVICRDSLAAMERRAIAAEEDAFGRWISVDERMPKPGCPVFVVSAHPLIAPAFNRRGVARATYYGPNSLELADDTDPYEGCTQGSDEDEWFAPAGWYETNLGDEGYHSLSGVTHWMLLPPLPLFDNP